MSGRRSAEPVCSLKSQWLLNPEASTTRRSVSSPHVPRAWLELKMLRNCSVSLESDLLFSLRVSSCCRNAPSWVLRLFSLSLSRC